MMRTIEVEVGGETYAVDIDDGLWPKNSTSIAKDEENAHVRLTGIVKTALAKNLPATWCHQPLVVKKVAKAKKADLAPSDKAEKPVEAKKEKP